jgi:hypothetical protein
MSQNPPKTHCVLNELIDKTQNDKVRMIPLFQKLEYLYATILPKPKATMCEKWRNKKDPITAIISYLLPGRENTIPYMSKVYCIVPYIWDCIFSSRYIYDTAAWILACIGWIEKQTAQQEEGSSTFLVGTEIE